jgi:GAF domain-containing protein
MEHDDVSFGTRLRLQRERQQVALDKIAARTKIKLSLLEALERDDISHWPEGIFRRAYIRAYGQAIGLDPDELVREFLQVYPDSVIMPPQGATPWPEPAPDPLAPPPTGIRRLVTSAITAVPVFLQRAKGGLPINTLNLRPETQPPARRAASEDQLPLPDSQASLLPDDQASANSRPSPTVRSAPLNLSLAAAAQQCTQIARAVNAGELQGVLEDVAHLLGAAGLIVWLWQSPRGGLTASLVYGYSEAVRQRLPAVPKDAENAVATAFRTEEPCIVNGTPDLTGAVVVPLHGRPECIGVLALEFDGGREQDETVRPFAEIVAAQLALFFGSAPLTKAVTA